MENRTYFLRPLRDGDAARMLEWMRDEDVTRHLRISGSGMTVDDTRAFITGAQNDPKNLHRAVTAEDGLYYGTVSLKNIDMQKREAEYAISLHPDAIGTGAAKSATAGILRAAFEELHLTRVYLNVVQENQRAIRFYEKFGFRYYDTSPMTLKGQKTLLRWYEIREGETLP